jgi:RAB protein geranylgeranyltransferase component A
MDEYDVVVCGTDLIQSILSSALSRAGKRVLHCDGNEWYGGFDAVLSGGSTLDSFIEGCEQSTGAKAAGGLNFEINENENGDKYFIDSMLLRLLPRGEHGCLRLHSQTFKVAPKESDVTENVTADAPSQTQSIPERVNNKNEEEKFTEEMTNDEGCTAENGSMKNDLSPANETTFTNLSSVSLEHGFCFDLTPSLLYASGDAVECLIKSGVSDYLEFKSLRGLYLITEDEKSSATRVERRKRSTVVNNTISSDRKKMTSYRVPCSKGDVFRSKLLSPVDKRRLMKLLQLISDYGMATQMESDQSSNNASDDGSDVAPTLDGTTQTGDDYDDLKASPDGVSGEDAITSINERYLHRGRALSRPQNKATPSSSEMDSLMRCIRENVSFSDFLTKVIKLPERLSTIVIYSMALATFDSWEPSKIGEDSDSMSIISQYSTKDGLDDLVRHLAALGRFGDTAFLIPMYGSGELSQAFCRSGAVYGSTYMLRRSPLAVTFDEGGHVKGVLLSGEGHIGGRDDLDTDDVSDREVPCKHVVVPSTMLASQSSSKARTYRRISVLQGKLVLDEDQNKDAADSEQRYALIVPPGTCGLGNKSAIHGIAVDDSAFVAPSGKNYTLLHLTTSNQEGNSLPDDMFVNVLSETVKYLIANQGDDAPCFERDHISFSYSTYGSNFCERKATASDQPFGLHTCHRDIQSLTCDSSFREAHRIFRDICPDSDFLAIAKKVEDTIVYRNENDSDDEKIVLESACTMIQRQTMEKSQVENLDYVDSGHAS